MSNPNENNLSVLLSAPSIGSYTITLNDISENIIIDLNNPCTSCKLNSTYNYNISDVQNINISSLPPNSRVLSIVGSLTVDSTKPSQVIILYDEKNKIIDKSNLSLVKKIEAHLSDWKPPTPYYQSSSGSITLSIILSILIICGIGYGFYYYRNNSKKHINNKFSTGE